ncbi:MAG TPA: DUF2809 domain-containing protein [Bosea sp. (in: a-proteobacteria)]
MMTFRSTRRAALAFTAILVIAIGLTTRLPGIGWSPIVAKYLGSLFWGAMVYCLVAWLLPSWRPVAVALVASCIAVLIEFSQLWHQSWLDEFRATRLGVLLIGRFFAWADIAAYLAGIAVVAGIDRFRLKAALSDAA